MDQLREFLEHAKQAYQALIALEDNNEEFKKCNCRGMVLDDELITEAQFRLADFILRLEHRLNK